MDDGSGAAAMITPQGTFYAGGAGGGVPYPVTLPSASTFTTGGGYPAYSTTVANVPAGSTVYVPQGTTVVYVPANASTLGAPPRSPTLFPQPGAPGALPLTAAPSVVAPATAAPPPEEEFEEQVGAGIGSDDEGDEEEETTIAGLGDELAAAVTTHAARVSRTLAQRQRVEAAIRRVAASPEWRDDPTAYVADIAAALQQQQ